MVDALAPGDYLEKPYEKGIHVVLLHCEDTVGLWRQAMASMETVSHRFYGSPNVRLWECVIRTPEDAEAVEVARMPQFRFFLNGAEHYTYTGVMSPEEIARRIFAVGDKR